MRTTVTLTPESEALIKREMEARKMSFKEVLNEAIVRGLGSPRPRVKIDLPVHHMGKPRISLDKASQLAGELENEEILRKMSMGK
jgi:predicted HTH domain antitoxin